MSAPDPHGPDTPYAGLGPEVVLDALDAVGLRADGRLLQLNSYENRVYQVFLEGGRVVVAKFYRPGRWTDAQILEEHAFAGELAAEEIPLAAPIEMQIDDRSLHAQRARSIAPTLAALSVDGDDYRFAIAPRMAGRAPELEDMEVLEWIGRFVGRIHAVGSRSSFVTRLHLDVPTFGTGARDWLLEHDIVPDSIRPAWTSVIDAALDQVGGAFDAVRPRTLRLHGDCHPGNILWSASGPHFVDLDDALTGPAIQDLWMLLSGGRADMTRQLAAVLDGYEQFMEFDWRELRLIEPLRTLRMIHHSAWIARRWRDPAFPAAFPWFESPSYWAEQAQRLRDQLDAMAEPPLGAPS